MKKGIQGITGESIRKVAREALSPTFLFILLGAALLWYTSKLSYEYTTEMPIGIRIDGQKYRLTATVKGRGSSIVAQRLSLKSRLGFTIDELSSRRSTETPGALIITAASLQNAINGKISNLEIVRVNEAPEFIPAAAEVDEPEDTPPNGESAKEKRQRERKERREAKKAARAVGEAAGAESAGIPETEESK